MHKVLPNSKENWEYKQSNFLNYRATLYLSNPLIILKYHISRFENWYVIRNTINDQLIYHLKSILMNFQSSKIVRKLYAICWLKIPRNQHSLNIVERILDTQTHCAKKVWSHRIACPLSIVYTFALAWVKKHCFYFRYISCVE